MKELAQQRAPYNISLERYCQFLLAVVAFFIVAHISLNYADIRYDNIHWLIIEFFHLDEENNLPTWFSSFMLANNALLLAIIAIKATSYRLHWHLLAIGFLILSIDEVAGIHESFNTVSKMNWTLVGAVLVADLFVIYIPFLRSLQPHILFGYVSSGAIFVSGALVIEFFSRDIDSDSMTYIFATAAEEGMEMFGSLLFLFFNFTYLKQSQGSVVIDIR